MVPTYNLNYWGDNVVEIQSEIATAVVLRDNHNIILN